MNRKWIRSIVVGFAILSLAGCGKSVDEQVSEGLDSAQTTFEQQAQPTNKNIGNIEIYLPKGYTIEEAGDDLNFTLTKYKKDYILFVNENETEDSQLQYDLLMQDSTKNIVEQQTFETDGVFGFSAVVQHSETEYELIVNIGGIKLSTISDAKKIDEKLKEMMSIVRSIKRAE